MNTDASEAAVFLEHIGARHPHILPLFDSGEADGFLYHVMPYIEGETIREKLTRETQFGIDEAVRITRELPGFALPLRELFAPD